MKNIYHIRYILRLCYYKNSKNEITIWNSMFKYFKLDDKMRIVISIQGIWRFIYNFEDNTFTIPDIENLDVLKTLNPTVYNIINNGKKYIISTGQDDVDFQNSMLYNVIEASEEWEALKKYIDSIGEIK